MKTFLQYIKPYWKWVLLTIVFIALQSLSDLYLPALNAKIIDDGVMTGDLYALSTLENKTSVDTETFLREINQRLQKLLQK